MKTSRALMRKAWNGLVATWVAISLMGCASAPMYQKPQAPTVAESKAAEWKAPVKSPGIGEIVLVAGAAAVILVMSPFMVLDRMFFPDKKDKRGGCSFC